MPLFGDLKRSYQRAWLADRRAHYLKGAVCARCGSCSNLELDHIDPARKVSHRIWSWSKARIEAELEKCQWLCFSCHRAKTVEDFGLRPGQHGTPDTYRRGCRCGGCRNAYAQHRRAWKSARSPDLHRAL